jgi:hypothetical protein
MPNSTGISGAENYIRIIWWFYPNSLIFIRNVGANIPYLVLRELSSLCVKQYLTFMVTLSNMDSKLVKILDYWSVHHVILALVFVLLFIWNMRCSHGYVIFIQSYLITPSGPNKLIWSGRFWLSRLGIVGFCLANQYMSASAKPRP